jgi:hypothetical protein
MHAPDDEGARASVRLRAEKYALMWAVLGATTDEEIATATGVHARTVRRARNEGILGEVFMAQTVLALNRHRDRLDRYGLKPSLDELFEVCESVDARTA